MGTDIDCAEDQTALTIVDGVHLYFFRFTSPFFFVILFRTAISRVIQSATKPTDQIADAMRRMRTHVSAYIFLFFPKRNIL